MEVIAVFNTKGGSGKSAATVFLADFLATIFKKRVLVVDLDPQQSSSVALLGEERLFEGFGRKKSLPLLMQRALKEAVNGTSAAFTAIERPRHTGRKGTVYLGPLHVMASERESWYDLDDALSDRLHARQDNDLLRRLLQPIHTDYDICLIDFPGHEAGPITKNGLRAADWWLFPCVPDRAGTRDIEGTAKTIKDAYRDSQRQMKVLGTLLSVSQSAATSEYRQSVQMLRRAVEQGIVPKLFSDKARMLIWTGAKNALDDTLWGDSTTLNKKYKEKPLFEAARSLSKEVLARLDIPAEEVRLNLGLLDGLNNKLRQVFVGAKSR